MEPKKKVAFYTKKLYLNTEYIVTISSKLGARHMFQGRGLFIQTSPKGYNFLNLATGKCYFSRALSSYNNEISGNEIRMKFIENVSTEAVDKTKETISEKLGTFTSFIDIIVTTPKSMKRKLTDIRSLTD